MNNLLINTFKEAYFDLQLLCCGGASGHLRHLFEDPDLTFKQLKDIFTKLFQGKISIQEKCLAPNTVVTLKHNGEKTIQDVVDNKIQDDILTYDFENNISCFEPITDWTKNTNTNEYVLDVTIEVLTVKTTVSNYIYGINSKVVTNGMVAIKINQRISICFLLMRNIHQLIHVQKQKQHFLQLHK